MTKSTSIILPFLVLLLSILALIIPNSAASSPAAAASPSSPPAPPSLTNFLQCLPTITNVSNSSFPITDSIYTQQNSSFSSVLVSLIRNSRFNTSTTPKPEAIITPTHYSHVQATVLCARTNHFGLRIRSGGHDFDGLSYTSHLNTQPFILLDMFNLRNIHVDHTATTVWAEAGATLGELYYEIGNVSNDLGFPAGLGITVGLGGHFSGGGYGFTLREHDLSVDHIVDAKVVDADGRILLGAMAACGHFQCPTLEILDRKSMGEDLFWAIRGGGAASFCVVLAWRIKLVPVPETVTVFTTSRTLEQGATDVLLEWQKLAPATDRKLFIRAQPQVIPTGAGNKTVRVTFFGLYLGRTNDLFELTNASFPVMGLKRNESSEMRWVQSFLYFNGLNPQQDPLEALLQRTPSSPGSYHKNKSDYVRKPIPRKGWEAVWKKMIEQENILMQFNPYGGMMSEVPEGTTPFPHRKGVLFKIQYISFWQEDGAEADNRFTNMTKALYDAFGPYVTRNPREAFLNYRDIDIGMNVDGHIGFGVDYFGGNMKRLLQVKAKVDPHDFFRYEQSIPVLAELLE